MAHLGQEREVVGEARLLVPVDIEFGEAVADADRMRGRKAAVRLDQDLEIGPHGRAHLPHILNREILVLPVDMAAPGAGERVELGGREAHRLHFQRPLDPIRDRGAPGPAIGVDAHSLARSAAEEVVDRQPGALADDIPRGDLDRAPRR